MPEEDEIFQASPQTARIAVYDDLLSAPRVVDIPPVDVATYIEQIASKTYELSQAAGSSIPYTVIREVAENFIHAHFKEPCVSILDHGNTIRFADQGPGIEDKGHAQLPGFTSATSEMKKYIRGVGSGLPIVKEYLRFSKGRLVVEDNVKDGTVITVMIEEDETPIPQQVSVQAAVARKQTVDLDARERDVLALAGDMALIGPTEVSDALGLSVSTAYRVLEKLEKANLLEVTGNRKRMLTDEGFRVLNG